MGRAILRAELPDSAKTNFLTQSYIYLEIPLTEFFSNLSVQPLGSGTFRFYPLRYGRTLSAVGQESATFHTQNNTRHFRAERSPPTGLVIDRRDFASKVPLQ
jgi:hypothetical protein